MGMSPEAGVLGGSALQEFDLELYVLHLTASKRNKKRGWGCVTIDFFVCEANGYLMSSVLAQGRGAKALDTFPGHNVPFGEGWQLP